MFMGLEDKELLVVDKKQAFVFFVSPITKEKFVKARIELGEFGSNSAFFQHAVLNYIMRYEEKERVEKENNHA